MTRYLNSGCGRSSNSSQGKTAIQPTKDSFDSDDLLFDKFLDMEQFIDWTAMDQNTKGQSGHKSKATTNNVQAPVGEKGANDAEEVEGPVRLNNGKWACNHKCKDKTTYGNSKREKYMT